MLTVPRAALSVGMSSRNVQETTCRPCWTAAPLLISITRMPLPLMKRWSMLPAFTPHFPTKARPIPLKPITPNYVTTSPAWQDALAVFPGPCTPCDAPSNSLSLPGIVANSLSVISQNLSLIFAISYTLDLCHSRLSRSNLKFIG